MPSVRVRRRHAYASIRDDDRDNAEHEQVQDQTDRGRRRALSDTDAAPPRNAPSPSASDAGPTPVLPHEASSSSPNRAPFRGDLSRVNRLARASSFTYRSFTADEDSNMTNSPPSTVARLSNIPTLGGTIYEGTSAEVVVPGPQHGHAHRSVVQSALSSSPSRRGQESDSDSDYDSEDEERIMEDDEHHHDDQVVDHLDVIDPQVATFATLTNTANSILLPPLAFYSRRPVVILPRTGRDTDIEEVSTRTTSTDELDRHVHDVLKRRQKFRRVMKGVWAFLKTPLGFVFGVYGFFVVFWGTAIVLFLAKWINLHNQETQDFWVEICSQILNGLFCLTGIGLIPWRCVDTYRIYKIWYYKRRTRKLRKRAGLPELYDNDDLPDPMFDPNYVHVLTDQEQYELHHQQKKFMKSQTWYRPHGTETHRAFPIALALWICLLNIGNTVFQCMLAGCMWSMNRFERPAWTVALLIPLAFGCGIASGILIWRGGKKTKRTERVEERLRRVLEMEESEHAVPPDGVMARIQDVISRYGMGNKEHTSSEKESSSVGKHVEPSHDPPLPGIKIEEEMVVPPTSG